LWKGRHGFAAPPSSEGVVEGYGFSRATPVKQNAGASAPAETDPCKLFFVSEIIALSILVAPLVLRPK